MIDAELRGKLGRNYSRAHERAEDVLTSTVFGLFRYIEWNQGLGAFLRRARSVSLGADGELTIAEDESWIPCGGGASGVAELWPRVPVYGEPDVLVRVFDAAGCCVAELIVEAKLWSGKSSSGGHRPQSDDVDRGSDPDSVVTDADEEDSEEDASDDAGTPVDPDQLVRYWQLLRSRPTPAGQPLPLRAVVYLTAHPSPPDDELRESLEAASGIRLLWVSWHDAWDVARRCSGSLPADDLARLLAHKGMFRFQGFSVPHVDGSLAPVSFWRGMRWFVGYPGEHNSAPLSPRPFWRNQ